MAKILLYIICHKSYIVNNRRLGENEHSNQILATLGKLKKQHMANLQEMPILC